MTFQLKHIKGIPYFIKNNLVHTFELENGQPSQHCIAIGSYNEVSDSITYDDGWFNRVQPHLEAFRSRVVVIDRSKLNETADKLQKPRNPPANKSKSSRAKSVKSD